VACSRNHNDRPTESESLAELDRFCEAMLLIGEEISEIENNIELNNNNEISNAPHTLKELIADNWNYPYSKEKASFPYKTPTTIKFWSSVSRINNNKSSFSIDFLDT